MTEERSDRFTALEERYAGYEVYDPQGEKIGKVDDLFVNENDQPEYIGVKMGVFGLKSTLIPVEIITNMDEERRVIEVSQPKSKVKDAPAFDDDDEDITPEHEDRVYRHFGLERTGASTERGRYGPYYSDSTSEARADATSGATPGYRRREESRNYPGVSVEDRDTERLRERPPETTTEGSEGGTTDTARMRVRRTGEERPQASAETGAEEHESGNLRVRKRVRTDREQTRVPIKREEARVERGPEGDLRIRKEIVEDEQTVEVDVKREEVDVEDEGELDRS